MEVTCCLCAGRHHALTCSTARLDSHESGETGARGTTGPTEREIEAERLSKLIGLLHELLAEDDARFAALAADFARSNVPRRNRDRQGCFRRGKVTV